MRLALLSALVLTGCGWDTSDLGDSTDPNKVKFCTELAQMNGAQGAVYDNDLFLRCMHGSAAITTPDGGAHD
jgi:hypothetical protein